MMKKNCAVLLLSLIQMNAIIASDGTLDPTFNGTGQETTVFTDGTNVFPAQGDSVLIEPPSNQILVAGTIDTLVTLGPPLSIGMARYNADGTLDTNFIGDGSTTPGTVLFGFGAGAPLPLQTAPCYGNSGLEAGNVFSSISTVHLQSTGQIVVACSALNTTNKHSIFGVARFNSTDGSNDVTFNALDTPGFVIGPFGFDGATSNISNCLGMAIQADDKIVCVGALRLGGSTTDSRWLVERFTADGVLDTLTFNSLGSGGNQPGTVSAAPGTCNAARAVIIRPSDQEIVFTGTLDNFFFISEIDSLGNAGSTQVFVTIPGTNATYAIAMQTDGKFVVAGSSTSAGVTQFLVARINPDFTLDSSFGSGGFVLTSFNGIDDEARGVAIQSDGKILVDGFTTIGGTTEFALARYLTDGTLDPSFGTGGKVTTPFSGASGANAITIQPDGKIVAAGFATPGGTLEFAVARYTCCTTPVPPTPGTTCITNIDALTQAIRTKYGS